MVILILFFETESTRKPISSETIVVFVGNDIHLSELKSYRRNSGTELRNKCQN